MDVGDLCIRVFYFIYVITIFILVVVNHEQKINNLIYVSTQLLVN